MRINPSVPPHCIWQRIESRARVAMDAVVSTVHGRRPSFLLNLSCHGAMIRTRQPPGRHDFAILKCGPLEALGMVAWVEQDRFGLLFDEPIDEGLVIAVRRLGDQVARDLPPQGRPGLKARPLTAAEIKAAEDWAVSSKFR